MDRPIYVGVRVKCKTNGNNCSKAIYTVTFVFMALPYYRDRSGLYHILLVMPETDLRSEICSYAGQVAQEKLRGCFSGIFIVRPQVSLTQYK